MTVMSEGLLLNSNYTQITLTALIASPQLATRETAKIQAN